MDLGRPSAPGGCSARCIREVLRDAEGGLAPFEESSTRECEVLGELTAGQSVDDSTERISVTVATVDIRVCAILCNLDETSQVTTIDQAFDDADWIPPQRH